MKNHILTVFTFTLYLQVWYAFAMETHELCEETSSSKCQKIDTHLPHSFVEIQSDTLSTRKKAKKEVSDKEAEKAVSEATDKMKNTVEYISNMQQKIFGLYSLSYSAKTNKFEQAEKLKREALIAQENVHEALKYVNKVSKAADEILPHATKALSEVVSAIPKIRTDLERATNAQKNFEEQIKESETNDEKKVFSHHHIRGAAEYKRSADRVTPNINEANKELQHVAASLKEATIALQQVKIIVASEKAENSYEKAQSDYVIASSNKRSADDIANEIEVRTSRLPQNRKEKVTSLLYKSKEAQNVIDKSLNEVKNDLENIVKYKKLVKEAKDAVEGLTDESNAHLQSRKAVSSSAESERGEKKIRERVKIIKQKYQEMNELLYDLRLTIAISQITAEVEEISVCAQKSNEMTIEVSTMISNIEQKENEAQNSMKSKISKLIQEANKAMQIVKKKNRR